MRTPGDTVLLISWVCVRPASGPSGRGDWYRVCGFAGIQSVAPCPEPRAEFSSPQRSCVGWSLVQCWGSARQKFCQRNVKQRLPQPKKEAWQRLWLCLLPRTNDTHVTQTRLLVNVVTRVTLTHTHTVIVTRPRHKVVSQLIFQNGKCKNPTRSFATKSFTLLCAQPAAVSRTHYG